MPFYSMWLFQLEMGYRAIARDKKEIDKNPTCEVCGTTLKTIVHHKDLNPFNTNIENLQIVCRKCHGHIHWTLKTSSNYPELRVNALLAVYEITKQVYPEEAKYMANYIQKKIDYWSKRGGRTPPLLDPPAIPGIFKSRFEIIYDDDPRIR